MTKKSKIVLIVEDEQSLLKALADKFTREGFKILEAKNGKEGLVVASHHHPDLILLDIIMPVMDGMTMLFKLREKVWCRNVPVILLTNLSEATERIVEAHRRGVNDYLIKSDWTLEDIVHKVKKKLEVKK
ncbi:MAG: response regulator [Patescibacteria group bacterium]